MSEHIIYSQYKNKEKQLKYFICLNVIKKYFQLPGLKLLVELGGAEGFYPLDVVD